MSFHKDAIVMGAAFVALIDNGCDPDETLHAILNNMPWPDEYRASVYAYLMEVPFYEWSVNKIEEVLEKADGQVSPE